MEVIFVGNKSSSRVNNAKVKNRSRLGINKWYQSFALRNFDLEETIKKNPLLTRKTARVVLSEDDSSKQGRIDDDPNTYFHQDNEVDDDVVHDTAKERQPEDSTAGIEIS
ncbi:hypothetical protein Tco_0845420, partial [Tanacetum coccineum]